MTIGYAAAQGWLWSINIGSDSVNSGWLYGLGYGPALLILFLNVIAGLHYPNEDLELMRQRVARGRAVDAQLGINRRARKPWWWRKVATDMGLDNDAKLRQLAMSGEVGGGPATGRNVERGIELGVIDREAEEEERRREREEDEEAQRGIFMGDPRSRPFRDEEDEIEARTGSGFSGQSGRGWMDGDGDGEGVFRDMTSPRAPGQGPRVESVRSFGTDSTMVDGFEGQRMAGRGQGQRVRSMLDI